MDAGFEAHLQVGEETFDGRDAALLRAVADRGSLNAAASALGRSYSRAHGRIGDLEAQAGSLVERDIDRLLMHAQTHVQAFYLSLDYETTSDVFEEAGIDHVEMEKEL